MLNLPKRIYISTLYWSGELLWFLSVSLLPKGKENSYVGFIIDLSTLYLFVQKPLKQKGDENKAKVDGKSFNNLRFRIRKNCFNRSKKEDKS